MAFQSKSETVPIWPIWFNIMLSSHISLVIAMSDCFSSSTAGLSSSKSSPRFQKIMLSPEEARYWLLNGENLTAYTFALCLASTLTTDLEPSEYAFRVSIILTSVSLDPVAIIFVFNLDQSHAFISEVCSSFMDATALVPVLKSQILSFLSTPTLQKILLLSAVKLRSSTFSLCA